MIFLKNKTVIISIRLRILNRIIFNLGTTIRLLQKGK